MMETIIHMPRIHHNNDGDDYSYAKDSSSEGKDYSDRTLVYSGTPKGFTDKAKTIQDDHLGF